MNFDELPHVYHLVDVRFGVKESSVPPMPAAPATEEPSGRLVSISSSPGPPSRACTSDKSIPALILSKFSFVIALLPLQPARARQTRQTTAAARFMGRSS